MPPNVTELENRLASPEGADLKAFLLKHSRLLEHEWRSRLTAGLPKNIYVQWQEAADAAAAATQILEAWPDAAGSAPPSSNRSPLMPTSTRRAT